jgi:hypothetical protein
MGGQVELARLLHRRGWTRRWLAGLVEETRRGVVERSRCCSTLVGSLRPPPSPLCLFRKLTFPRCRIAGYNYIPRFKWLP